MRSWMFASLFLAVPAVAAAQNRWSVAPYMGANLSLPGKPAMMGVAGGYSVGPFGVRGGLAIESPWRDAPADAPGSGAFTTDVDLRLAWRTSGRTVPAVFAGVGLEGAREAGDMRVLPLWSAGAGLGYELFSWARLESEARLRSPFGGSLREDDAFSRGFELRAGIAVSWSAGRGAATPRNAPPVVVARDPGRWSAPRTPEELDAVALRILDSAEGHLGTRYVWGGSTPAGFDCSGFLQYVFRAHGLHLPRVSRQMAQVGAPLPRDRDAWEVGDLLFFASNGRTVDHVAMYAGDGRIIHSSDSGGGVRYDQLSSNRGSWFVNHLVAARRVLDDGALLSPSVITTTPGAFDPPDKAPPVRGSGR
jgi:cell wall-associated NlpC family hydrolase